jgi:hypothetical protein
VNEDPVMIVFFDLHEIVRATFVPRNTTVNSEYYKGLLKRLRKDLCRKASEAATTAQLKTLTKVNFQNCFRMWQEGWDKWLRSKGKFLRG